MLQGGRCYTANDIASELEVSRRTVFRDLKMLEMAHIPYYFDAESGGYKISEHFFLPPVNLTITEALALLMLAGRLRGAGRLPLLSQSSRAAAKLESALPGPIRNHVGTVLKRVSVDFGPVSNHAGCDAMFDQLAGAVAEHRVCRLVYLSFKQRQQLRMTVLPMKLAFIGRAWYVIAYSLKDKALRTLKLGRIRKVVLTERLMEPPPQADPDKHFGAAWSMIPEGCLHDVHLRFSPKVAGNVAEVQWHSSQQLQWRDDGTLDFRATVDGLGEITWWILGYGDQVQVVAPGPLRDSIAQVARRMLASHEGDPS
jgi:proteasome accessory factor B